jgi:hypothetical protein
VEILTADSGKIYAYGTRSLHVASFANGLEWEEDLQDVYYAPEVHVRLVSLGKLESQGWGIRLCDGGMELQNQGGDLFANIDRVNNVYPMALKVVPPKAGLAVQTNIGEGVDPTHKELVDCLQKVVLAATAK